MKISQALIAVVISISISTNIHAQVNQVKNMTCPESPNCVSSQAKETSHYIEPFIFTESPEKVITRLKAALLNEKRVTIVEEEATYLKAEVRSLIFRFIDDVEFTIIPGEKLIHLRSASRTGYSDFGVNRKRIERIRKNFQNN
jgi:uncharacterized protein (DUF1499 family)